MFEAVKNKIERRPASGGKYGKTTPAFTSLSAVIHTHVFCYVTESYISKSSNINHISANSVTQHFLHVVYYYNSPYLGKTHSGIRYFTVGGSATRDSFPYSALPPFLCEVENERYTMASPERPKKAKTDRTALTKLMGYAI
jgi:hypothetical protein